MEDFERTTWFTGQATAERAGSSQVTIFDGSAAPRTIKLDEFGKDCVYFGRDKGNDIVLTSHLVSGEHGRFVYRNNVWVIEDKVAYKERGSTNGLVYNECSVVSRVICDGDLIRIDDVENALAEGVLFVFSSGGSGNQWNMLPLAGRRSVSIGRDESCDITLPHVSVSKFHAQIICDNGSFYIVDNNSTNGVIVNGVPVSRRLLHEKDVITITNSKLIFSCASIFYCCYKSGISVDARDIVIKRGRGRKSAITCNHVDLSINPGELVAVIGGSGAGKSTILNCMCGYIKPDNGDVFINGVNLYQNFDALKKVVGYVPQSDIVYDNLTLYDMLMYTSKLRLPKDTTPQEREAAISRAIELVELTEKRKSLIRSLSGGQRKRASIAVELLSDPNLMFLDEPASGLDPGTERNLMQSLRKMADGGKTVILVTHSTLQLKMCDKIVFMGKGGNLCFCGSLDEALKFFGVSDVVDVYNMITEQAPQWSAKYRQYSSSHRRANRTPEVPAKSQKNRLSQLGVLSARYLRLVTNDRQRLFLLLVQAPLLAVLITLVADGGQFEQYDMTKSLLFALSCSAFWVGMLNSIQEICKERNIMKREYMTGLSLTSYIMSKIIVLGVLSMIQSVLIVGVFCMIVGMPEEGLIMNPLLELLITTFLTAISSTAMGLFVSSLFTNADRAMTVAPILLMPQILFSGLIFKLDGATEIISWFAVCRWSMEGYGTSANLNDLPMKLQLEGLPITHEAESFFDYTCTHLLTSWGILLAFTAAFLILARLVLSKVGRERA